MTDYQSLQFRKREALSALLAHRMLSLPFHEFATCIARSLEYEGYQRVELKGRYHWRGRTSLGGFDMEGRLPSGERMLIQIKRYRRPVTRHDLDVLRGAMLRFEAPTGLIVTTSTFSRTAIAASVAYTGRPIRLIAREELGHLLFDAGVGVVWDLNIATGDQEPRLDEESFERLSLLCAEQRKRRKGGA